MTRARLSAGKTLRLNIPAVSDLDPDSLYVFSAPGSEPRGRAPVWDACLQHRPGNCIQVLDSTASSLRFQRHGSAPEQIPLNDQEALGRLFSGFRSAYLDVSGFPHHVWAPILRVGFGVLEVLKAVYAEPKVYKRHPSPTSKTEYDLSEGFRGIEPLPGFAKLRGPEDEKQSVLVALLGFEGKRASYVALTLDPVPKVFAIVGVPGFRVEYPQITHASNADFLDEFDAFQNIRYAAASCPFEAFDALADIARDVAGKYMYVAPVGTKPHSLGAICFALKNPARTEVMYDNPVKKAGRTGGIGVMHVYTLKPSYLAP